MEDIYTYEYGFYYPPASRKLGSMITGMIGAYQFQNFPVLLIAGLVLVYVWSKGGTEIDRTNKKYRDYQDFYAFKRGEWKDLQPKYISVFKAKMALEADGSGKHYSMSQYQVNLITENKKRINLFEAEEMYPAFEKAKELSELFKLRIWDATAREGRWLNEVPKTSGPF
jgi:hypothetical protein